MTFVIGLYIIGSINVISKHDLDLAFVIIFNIVAIILMLVCVLIKKNVITINIDYTIMMCTVVSDVWVNLYFMELAL